MELPKHIESQRALSIRRARDQRSQTTSYVAARRSIAVPVSPGASSAIRFGPFELDVRSRELRKGAARIPLQDQPFKVLHLMLQRPGEVVTRKELCQRLWPDGTYVDFEHSLNAAVKRLRAVLGDDPDRPRFVETLPRRGYRFIATLHTADAGTGTVDVDRPTTLFAPPSSVATSTRLAVLPFSNFSADPTHDYFSDGVTEELITQLGQVCRGRIAVIARRSSMVFRGTSLRASEIARMLTAAYLLEGSVRRDGDRVRITAHLVAADTETQLWSDTHDHTVDDWLSAQADVAAHVTRLLMLELRPPHTVPVPDAAAHRVHLKRALPLGTSARSTPWQCAGHVAASA